MQLYLLIHCLELIRTHRSVCLSAQTQATLSGVFSSRVVKNTDHEMKTLQLVQTHKHSHRNRYFCWIPLATISHCCGSSLVWMCVCPDTQTIHSQSHSHSHEAVVKSYFLRHKIDSRSMKRDPHTHTCTALQDVEGKFVVVVVVTADRVRAEIKLDWNFNAPI